MVTFGFILGEVVRRVTGRTIGQYLRTEIAEPLGVDVHIGLPAALHGRCAEMVNEPHIRDVLAAGEAPGRPESLTEHPMAGLAVAMGLVPDDELGSNALEVWRRSSSPPPTRM
jgi:CubicO group peptidase (beta-lactamase class C family)